MTNWKVSWWLTQYLTWVSVPFILRFAAPVCWWKWWELECPLVASTQWSRKQFSFEGQAVELHSSERINISFPTTISKNVEIDQHSKEDNTLRLSFHDVRFRSCNNRNKMLEIFPGVAIWLVDSLFLHALFCFCTLEILEWPVTF